MVVLHLLNQIHSSSSSVFIFKALGVLYFSFKMFWSVMYLFWNWNRQSLHKSKTYNYMQWGGLPPTHMVQPSSSPSRSISVTDFLLFRAEIYKWICIRHPLTHLLFTQMVTHYSVLYLAFFHLIYIRNYSIPGHKELHHLFLEWLVIHYINIAPFF